MGRFTTIPLTPDLTPPVTAHQKMAADLIKAGIVLVDQLSRLVQSLENPPRTYTIRDAAKVMAEDGGPIVCTPAPDQRRPPLNQQRISDILGSIMPNQPEYPRPEVVNAAPAPIAQVHPDAPTLAQVQGSCQKLAELGIPTGMKFRKSGPALIPVVVFTNHQMSQLAYNLLCHPELLGQSRFDVSWNRDPAAPPTDIGSDVIIQYGLSVTGALPPNQE